MRVRRGGAGGGVEIPANADGSLVAWPGGPLVDCAPLVDCGSPVERTSLVVCPSPADCALLAADCASLPGLVSSEPGRGEVMIATPRPSANPSPASAISHGAARVRT